ncbi:L,D-transpeptidase family protein [Arsenicicoccus dermatophilus]|uniref:L,D-transpeptidase family protein n=1 Tax=Arsenicicoccus dermatophilus TaxID=1076331 RepID=UPI001F4D020F|nr:L,D-transpeptidase family protein [Arsenicicoccus dermatophilus]MCH8612966.1 hypothetical protein [Arsenicicoccus dermatophilus]
MTRPRLLAAALATLTTLGSAPAASASPAPGSPVARSTAPAAVPAATPAAVRRVYAPGTSISQLDSTQVLVADRVAGTKGTWARYSWNGSRWIKVNAPATAVFGRGGVVPAAARRQGTSTTPAGAFTLVSAFGQGNPGTRMAYRTVTSCSWWIQDPHAWDYNRWRQSCAVPRTTAANSERLATYVASGLYRQAVVIGYNYWNVRRYGYGSGSGIFLHHARSYTGGCVGIDNMAELTATVRWLDPRRHPVIVVKA